jgi:hypothetical protein
MTRRYLFLLLPIVAVLFRSGAASPQVRSAAGNWITAWGTSQQTLGRLRLQMQRCV